MRILIFCFLLLPTLSWATEDAGLACQSTVMSAPNCLNRINAQRFCGAINNDQRAQTAFLNCMSANQNSSSNEAAALCSGGFSSSNRPEDNETLCEVSLDPVTPEVAMNNSEESQKVGFFSRTWRSIKSFFGRGRRSSASQQ